MNGRTVISDFSFANGLVPTIYSGTCLIRHLLGNEKQCWISRLLDYRGQFVWYINGRCQRILAGLGKCWFIEVLD